MTNAEKFKEVFGFDDGIADANSESVMCREKKECAGCGYFGNLLYCAHFWNSEYKPTVEPQEWISVKDRLQIEQDNQGNLTAYCPHCHKAIWKTFKQENEDEDC